MICFLAGVLEFLEFGDNRKFVIDSSSSDAASEPISMPLGFPIGSKIHTLAFVRKSYFYHMIYVEGFVILLYR